MKFRVSDVKAYQNYVLHVGVLEEGAVTVGDSVSMQVDEVTVLCGVHCDSLAL